MSEERIVEIQTVKALSWQLLYGNYRPRLGGEGWKRLVETVEAPDFRKMDPDEDCLMGPFNEAVLYIDQLLGSGDGSLIEEITVASVERWASMFRNLVKQLQGRPYKMMEIFCTEVHPYFLNDIRSSTIVESAEDHFILRLDNGLLEGFKVGLIRGFCDIVGADAKIVKREDEYHITWKIRQDTPEPSLWSRFVNATRLPFLTATAVPVLLGTAIAWKDGFLNPWLFLIAFIGVACFHIGANVTNDYFDHKSGLDEANLTPTPFSGGSRMIQRGLLSARSTLKLALGAYFVGTALGLLLVWLRGGELVLFGAAGFVLGFLYTAPPVRLAYRGLGELAVGVGFGPVIVLGAYWVQTQRWSGEAVLASLPISFLIVAVLYINEFPDRAWDSRAGKRTLNSRLPVNVAVMGYALILGGAYLTILLGVGINVLPAPTLLGLLTAPMGWKAFKVLRRNFAYPYRLIPASATTIFSHLLTGMLLFYGYIFAGFGR